MIWQTYIRIKSSYFFFVRDISFTKIKHITEIKTLKIFLIVSRYDSIQSYIDVFFLQITNYQDQYNTSTQSHCS